MSNRLGRRGAAVFVLALLALPAGCATGSSAADGSRDAGVEVHNDLIPPAALTIYLVPESGVRRLIGNVGPGQTRTLSIREPMAGRHRLLARTTGGNDIVSNSITIGAMDTLRWNLSSNIVTTVSEDRPD
jgi:hypothetical protein